MQVRERQVAFIKERVANPTTRIRSVGGAIVQKQEDRLAAKLASRYLLSLRKGCG